MEFLKYFFIILLSLTGVVLLIIALYSKGFFKTLLLNAAAGIICFAAINLTSRYTGVCIPINYYSASFSTVLGLPGVFGMLIANFIFV